MGRKVCEGEFGVIRKREGDTELTEGLKLECPDGTVTRFPAESKQKAVQKARPWLQERNYDAKVDIKE